jgi:hypothetical protein
MKTSDMYLVAALLSYGAEFTSIDRSDSRRQVFDFQDKPIAVYKFIEDCMVTKVEFIELSQVEILFQSGKLMFMPDYPNKIRNVKNIIMNYANE